MTSVELLQTPEEFRG